MTTEDSLSIAFYNWMQLQFPKVLVFHVANERQLETRVSKNGTRYSPRGKKLQRMGVKAGVSDYLILKPAHGYAGLIIEMKAEKLSGVAGDGSAKMKRDTYPSPEQKEFMRHAYHEGYAVDVCWNLDEAMAVVKNYLNGTYSPCEYVKGFLNDA